MFQQISKNNYTDHTLNNYIFKFENKITKNSTRLLKTKKKTLQFIGQRTIMKNRKKIFSAKKNQNITCKICEMQVEQNIKEILWPQMFMLEKARG